MLHIKYLIFDLSKMLQIRVKVQKYIKSQQYTCFNMNGALKDMQHISPHNREVLNSEDTLRYAEYVCPLVRGVGWGVTIAA